MSKDYEKKYNEALERARKQKAEYQKGLNDCEDKSSQLAHTFMCGIAALEMAFPELAESEDERITRAINNMLPFIPDEAYANNGVTKEGVLNWLEKQKEEEGYEAIPVESTLEYKLGFKAGKESEKQKKPENVSASTMIPSCWAEEPSLQEEQKPADLSEMMVHKEPYIAPVPTPMVADEQKPVEWSEEDEKLFWGFTAYIPNEELERLGVTRDDILKKLKSIRPQPIQLKEAYKEGFQTARHATALTFMNYLDENRPEGKMSLSNGECEDIDKAFKENDWKKIMRYANKYSWKPSEEQMDALRVTIDFMPDTFKPRCTLITLQNGLEKLI